MEIWSLIAFFYHFFRASYRSSTASEVLLTKNGCQYFISILLLWGIKLGYFSRLYVICLQRGIHIIRKNLTFDLFVFEGLGPPAPDFCKRSRYYSSQSSSPRARKLWREQTSWTWTDSTVTIAPCEGCRCQWNNCES